MVVLTVRISFSDHRALSRLYPPSIHIAPINQFHLWLRTGMALALDTSENHAGMAGEVRRNGAGIGRPFFKPSTPQW